jgi:hypothetical protein
MAEYTIIRDDLRGYGVEVAWPGAFRSFRGFATEAEAQAWIDGQRTREADAPDGQETPGDHHTA